MKKKANILIPAVGGMGAGAIADTLTHLGVQEGLEALGVDPMWSGGMGALTSLPAGILTGALTGKYLARKHPREAQVRAQVYGGAGPLLGGLWNNLIHNPADYPDPTPSLISRLGKKLKGN